MPEADSRQDETGQPAFDLELLGRLVSDARGEESQAALSRRCGVSDRTISLIEHGGRDLVPRAATIARLAIATKQDAQKWLQLAGQELSDSTIRQIRQDIKLRISLDQLEPPDEIKKAIREEFELQYVQPREIYRTVETEHVNPLRKELHRFFELWTAKFENALNRQEAELKEAYASLQDQIDKLAQSVANLEKRNP